MKTMQPKSEGQTSTILLFIGMMGLAALVGLMAAKCWDAPNVGERIESR